MDKKTVIDLLINGNIQPAKYVVKEGDTPSTIAEKLDVPLQLIYNKNQHHKDLIDRDLIRIGDLLDVTMPKPAVTIESVQKVTETIAITHEIIYKEDKTMRNGSTKTIRPGKDGVKKVTYLLTRMNGFMVEEEITNEIIIDEPIPAIVKRGTRIIRGEGSGKFIWPVMSGRVSSGYGKRWGRQHKGIDIVSRNRNILVADHGKVIFAGRKDDYGNAVIVDHKNGYQTLYAHLSKITVKEGSIVEKGDKIGIMGDTGRSFGVHLHFEVIVNGKEKNPMSYLRI
jgi:murein DD-endopeptidase MepM/ murein hydrolase activator NlpD